MRHYRLDTGSLFGLDNGILILDISIMPPDILTGSLKPSLLAYDTAMSDLTPPWQCM